jgi:SAM-dependent methyltransferase
MLGMDTREERRPSERLQATCHVCGGMEAVILPFRYAFRGRHLHGVRCLSCSLVYVEPQPSLDEIAALYDEEYFTECSETCGAHGRDAYMVMAQEAGPEREAAARLLDARIVRHLGRKGRFLEVGCGPGFFLDAMRGQGWEVQGLEISRYAVEHATRTLGLPVVQGVVSDGRFADRSLDAIFLGDVLEHLPDPRRSLEIMKSWLRPGGILVVAVPSTMNLLSARLGLALYRARGRFKTLRIPPYHLFEYAPRSLRATLETSGLHVLEIRQSAVPLRRMGLRGNLLENAGKLSLQLLARATSRLFNSGGDRLTAVARRPED